MLHYWRKKILKNNFTLGVRWGPKLCLCSCSLSSSLAEPEKNVHYHHTFTVPVSSTRLFHVWNLLALLKLVAVKSLCLSLSKAGGHSEEVSVTTAVYASEKQLEHFSAVSLVLFLCPPVWSTRKTCRTSWDTCWSNGEDMLCLQGLQTASQDTVGLLVQTR